MFYSPIYGNIQLCEIGDGTFPLITEGANFMSDGRVENYQHGKCMFYPSRELYEQYPLDPLKAWMKWQEGQKKEYGLGVVLQNMNPKNCEVINGHTLLFRTPSDRDKCLSEIKAIIEKYSK